MNQMSRTIFILSLSVVMTTALPAVSAWADTAPQIRIDVPVTIKSAKVVFNMDHAAFSGDAPVGLKHMSLMVNRFQQPGKSLDLVGVFHGEAGYMLLNDNAYNKVRKITTGNPYTDMIQDLIKQGVQIEECAVTMKANNWGNDDLLPGVKVNAGALGRIVQLVQEGYVMIQP
ncbi:DsrE/DsrF-like family protein [mine drainage metagenome]|jgi:intracellular sulfur oxidation DsrE/DsrF family protein|uniref:DsrE/DsrF-like family protein n=1 Tax=mine drainage metagenome TaxID=410659 RepID=A0A1J5S4B5_9ZZZZ